MVASMPAKWQRTGRQGETPRLIVTHCTVSPEMGTGAEAVGRYFQGNERPGSTHLVSDNNSTVRCVADEDTAYGAAGANRDGLHIELVGQPDQSSAQWLDDYSRAELLQAGPHIRAWSRKYGIPLRWLTVAQVADGRTKGLCTHHDVSRAFPDVSTGHWDPGPNFPKTEALALWSPKQPNPFPQSTEDDVLIITCPGKPTRFLTGFTCSVVDGKTIDNLKAVGVKVCPFEPDDYEDLLVHVSDGLGR